MKQQYNVGEFNHKIVIQEETMVTNANGFSEKTWVNIVSPYAKIENTNGSRFFGASTDEVKKTSRFIIRYRSILKTKTEKKLQIIYDNRAYMVQYINNIDEKNEYQEIMAEAIGYGE
jgi:SPP1 family predicted phage head-tail adaptor